MRKTDPSFRGGAPADGKDDNLGGILTPTDEFQYWSDSASSAPKLSLKERAQHFYELFQPISKDFAGLDGLSMSEVLELVELTQDTLDEVWKQMEHDPPYSEARMGHLMDIIGEEVDAGLALLPSSL